MTIKPSIKTIHLILALTAVYFVQIAAAANSFYRFSESEQTKNNLETEALAILQTKLKDVHWIANHRSVVAAVISQNARKLSMEQIKNRDENWLKTTELTPFKKALQESEAGKLIRSLVGTGKVFNEIFITDNQGANVAAYPATTDYWQGDETKFTHPFTTGEIYIGEVEFDQSSQKQAVQLSVPIKHKGAIIGVVVTGISLSYLEYKMAKRLQRSKKLSQRFSN